MNHIGAFQYKLVHDAAYNAENAGPQIDWAQTQHSIRFELRPRARIFTRRQRIVFGSA